MFHSKKKSVGNVYVKKEGGGGEGEERGGGEQRGKGMERKRYDLGKLKAV